MNFINLEKKEKNTAELTVEITAEEFDKAVNAAYLKQRARISVPGFRKGKAPRKMIEKMYGENVFYEDALEAVYPEAYTFAVISQNVNVVGAPSLLDMQLGEDKSVTVKFGVSLYPEVTIGQYKGIEAPKPAVSVTDDEVASELEGEREKNARIQAVDRPAQMGDIVNIDYEGFMGGEPFKGGKDEKFDLPLGSGYFVPGFEDQLVGAKALDIKELNLTFPEDYAEELAGKDVVFKVLVNEVKEKLLPDLDDEFAKDVSEFDTLDELKADLKKKIEERKQNEADESFREVVMAKLIETMEAEIPEAMITERVDRTVEDYEARLSQQGMPFEEYLKMLGMTMESFREMSAKAAEGDVKEDLVLDKVAALEEIEIPDEEIEAEYDKIAEQYQMDKEEVKKSVDPITISEVLKRQKAAELVFNSAVVVDAPAEEVSPAKEKTEE